MCARGCHSFMQKDGKVWWNGKLFLIYFLMTDESDVICSKTVKIAWLCTPSGVRRQFCALKCVAWVCLSYFWLQCGNFDLFCITILVCFPLLFPSPSSILSDLFFHIVTHTVWCLNYCWKIFWHKISIYLVWAGIFISIRSLRNSSPTLILIFASFPLLSICVYIYTFFPDPFSQWSEHSLVLEEQFWPLKMQN